MISINFTIHHASFQCNYQGIQLVDRITKITHLYFIAYP